MQRPASLSPFALYAGPLITTSIAAAAAGPSAASTAEPEPELGPHGQEDIAPAAPAVAQGDGNNDNASNGNAANAHACGAQPHPGGSPSGVGPGHRQRGPRPSADPQQLSDYAIALYQELQAAEPPSPDTSTPGVRRPPPPQTPVTPVTRGSAWSPSWPFPWSNGSPAAATPAGAGAALSQQSSQWLFNTREYGYYNLHDQSSVQEQLITGYYTSSPYISTRSYRNSALPPTPPPSSWLQVNAASGTHVQMRNRFLRNVFGLLSLSLAAAAGAGTAVLAAPPDVARRLLLAQPWVLHLTLVLTLGTLLLLALSERLRRPHPHSLLAFAAFATGQALLVASATAALGTCLLVQAVGLAALALACVAACAQLLGRLADLTAGAGIAWCCAAVVLGWAGGAALEAVTAASGGGGGGGAAAACGAAAAAGLGRCSWVGHAAAAAAAAAAAFSMYAVVDVLALLYGRHAYAVHVDEHVFAALGVYLDPLNMALLGLHRLQLAMIRRGRARGQGHGPGPGRDATTDSETG